MSTPAIYNFADLGAALKQREQAKQPAKVADVPTEPVNNYPAPNWADIYGTTNASTDYLGYKIVIPGELGPGGYSSITMTQAEFDAKYGPGSRCPPMVKTRPVYAIGTVKLPDGKIATYTDWTEITYP